MRQFYARLNSEWFDHSAVVLAFGAAYPLTRQHQLAQRRAAVRTNICSLHGTESLHDIPVMTFLNTLHKKGVLHLLPTELQHFNDIAQLKDGEHGHHYQDLYRLGWFNSPRVTNEFNARANSAIKNRTQHIKDIIYWDLGIVSMTQLAPKRFYDYLQRRGLEKTLPVSLKMLIEQGGGHA